MAFLEGLSPAVNQKLHNGDYSISFQVTLVDAPEFIISSTKYTDIQELVSPVVFFQIENLSYYVEIALDEIDERVNARYIEENYSTEW